MGTDNPILPRVSPRQCSLCQVEQVTDQSLGLVSGWGGTCAAGGGVVVLSRQVRGTGRLDARIETPTGF
jgi:hypothetical protein